MRHVHAALIAALPATALAQSSFQGIGFLAGGTANESYPYAISGDGSTVVAYSIDSNGAGQPVRWTKLVGVQSLGEIPGGSPLANGEALGVNFDGSVITGSSPGPLGREAFRWTQATGMVGLGDLTTLPITQAYGVALSDDGSVIVGQGDYSYGLPGPLYGESMRWTQATGLVGLGHLASPPNQQYGTALDCSADGSVIIGWATNNNGENEAYRWTQATGMVSLGDLGPGPIDSGALGCSSDGNTIVGWVHTGTRYEPGVWTQGSGWTSLGVLPVHGTDNFATACTPDASVIVGACNLVYGGLYGYEICGESFVWDASNGMRNIKEELLLAGVSDVAGWSLFAAVDVADDGRTIVGIGLNPQGEFEGWVAVLDGPSSCKADCDQNGALNIFDYICFGNAYAAGCP